MKLFLKTFDVNCCDKVCVANRVNYYFLARFPHFNHQFLELGGIIFKSILTWKFDDNKDHLNGETTDVSLDNKFFVCPFVEKCSVCRRLFP